MPAHLTCELRTFSGFNVKRYSKRIDTAVAVASNDKKGGRLDHLLPRKTGRRTSMAHPTAGFVEETIPKVNDEQLSMALQVLSGEPTFFSSADAELNIISSLDLDEVLEEADKLRWEISPVDIDVLRLYGSVLVQPEEQGDSGSTRDA